VPINRWLAILAGAALVSTVHAQAADTTTRIAVHGFVDAYYAYDFGRPADRERRFTTQPVRHNEANVNLAWLGMTIERQRVRARVAVQAGTSVQANYAGEPRRGSTSGPDVARFLQEGVVGVRLASTLWIDAGVYLSYIGLESWSSSDNPTYTRSLVADYSPYYLSGAKLTWQPTRRLTAQLHVMNGWQNISENNNSKAVGGRIDYTVSPALTLSYANFFGNEQPDISRSQLRIFNQVMAKGTLPTATDWQLQFDVASEDRSDWYGVVAIARQPLGPRVALVGRLERFSDPDQRIVSTGSPQGFVANGASLGVDVQVDRGVKWRSEFRGTRATAAVYPGAFSSRQHRENALLVTSLSLAF
jgi:Putative beta-barrel porin-2, OmpL-like. bbp2